MADKGYQTMRGGVYDILNHKFLTRGHTFLKNDSDFAQIEKRKASAKVFVPSDWFSVVREASRRSPFEVVAMQQEEFKNYKDFIRSRYTNRHFSSGDSVFRDVHWLNFGWGEEVDPVSGKQLYHAPLVLKPAKIQDLKKMARHHIPHPQRDFYLQMSGEGDGGRETEEEDDD
ncbi:hypothetical protein P5673_022331 [Acropora cervicornis]|uniref:Uncharacterized protein n=1 Tax=Acropora cervicornis TaxID=6130 RepID=A0AAD9UZM1_ACRCE|nr:hypothetical protein P5673_022331 [Acropora cervicornis]